jgi:hypothetical protein
MTSTCSGTPADRSSAAIDVAWATGMTSSLLLAKNMGGDDDVTCEIGEAATYVEGHAASVHPT